MYLFSYERITDTFVQRVADKVLAAESTVLIGPRYGGKRHVLYLLQQLLQTEQMEQIVPVEFLDKAPLQTEGDVQNLIRQAVVEAVPGFSSNAKTTFRMTGPIQQLAAIKTPVILLASNVDAMAHHLARTFLEEVRILVESHDLITVLSGENDFHELVYGPKSEFNVASQFVIQGYGEREFARNLAHCLQYFCMPFEAQDETARHLWEMTGGNLNIAKILLSMISESRSDKSVLPETPVSISDLPTIVLDRVPDIYGAHFFRHARQLVDREPTCWCDLETLMGGRTLEIPASENSPSHLELAGVTVRVQKQTGSHLEFASPIMKQFIKHTYTNRRFGDLYARSNDWPTAFERYARLSPAERIRPSSSDDRNEVEATVNALCAALYSEATQEIDRPGPTATTVDRIRQLFAKGCQYVLGFRDVTFWSRDTEHSTSWYVIPMNDSDSSSLNFEDIGRLLPIDNSLTAGIFPLRGRWARYAMCAILPTLSPDQQEAVIVGDFKNNPAISGERKTLMEQLLRHFVTAYRHALAVSQTENRSRVSRRHIAIINDIFTAFRGHELSVQHILAMAARGLRQLNYRRVLFCLLDQEKNVLQGILDDCEPPLVSVAEKINYPIEGELGSLQVLVVTSKDGIIIKDATQSQIADQTVVRAGNMKAFAISPIINPSNEVIGTLLVERFRNAIPSKEELSDLTVFNRQLALAIEHCQRVSLLQSGLDGLPDPIFIVDPAHRLRYTNKPASDLLGIPYAGWQDESQSLASLEKEAAARILDIVQESFSSGSRLATHVEGLGGNKDYRGAVVANIITETFSEGRAGEKIVGGLLRIQDLTYLYKVFEASRHIAEAIDTQAALRNMLDAATKLGHERTASIWSRLYLVHNTDDGDQEFVSKVSSGFSDPAMQEEFDKGQVALARRSERGHKDWLCIEKREPVVFCWKEGLKDGELYITPHGLKTINWRAPKQPSQIKKKPGDFWIDFPLMTEPGKVLGKICLQCDESLRPENFVYLKMLSETFARLLEAYSNFDVEKRMISVAVAEKTMSTLAHNIGTRLGGLPAVWANYSDLEDELPDLKILNDDFAHILERTFEHISRANILLSPFNPKTADVDLAAEIEKTLRGSLPPKAWKVECDERPFKISIDSHLFETALLELVQNSRDAARDSQPMKVKIEIRSVKADNGETAAIVYTDNGPGIPAGLSERVFDDFYSRRPGKKIGTGLGLGFVRRVTEAHGGNAVCNGTRQKGAQFIITLPK